MLQDGRGTAPNVNGSLRSLQLCCFIGVCWPCCLTGYGCRSRRLMPSGCPPPLPPRPTETDSVVDEIDHFLDDRVEEGMDVEPSGHSGRKSPETLRAADVVIADNPLLVSPLKSMHTTAGPSKSPAGSSSKSQPAAIVPTPAKSLPRTYAAVLAAPPPATPTSSATPTPTVKRLGIFDAHFHLDRMRLGNTRISTMMKMPRPESPSR